MTPFSDGSHAVALAELSDRLKSRGARAGIADRAHRRVQVLSRPQDGKYRSEAVYLPGETVEIPGRVSCVIAVDDLLQGA